MKKNTARALLVTLIVVFSAQVGAQVPPPGSTPPKPIKLADRFPWSVEPIAATISAGDTLSIIAVLGIPDHHYVYAERTGVDVTASPGLVVGEIIADAPKVKYDTFEKRDVPQYDSPATFRIPLIADASAGGTFDVTLTLRTQGCSQTMCFFPTSVEHTLSVTVIPSDNGVGGALTDFSRTSEATDASGLSGVANLGNVVAERGVFLALGLMFIGGILTSFTPCVYPLIPITVSFFGAAGVGALRGFLLSLVFVLGMALMYSILGVTAAATGAVFGQVMANPIVIGVVATIFILFALSMFGAFKIQLPPSLQMRLQRVGGAGWGGAFLAGIVAGIIAAPCTGPVLGAALTYVATTGNLVFGFASMFVFAVGMGLLFMAIGTFSARIVPKGGAWLGKVESVFGIAMIVVALYFLKDVITPLRDLTRPGLTAMLVSLGLIVVGLALGAIHARFVAGFDRNGNLEPAPTWTERVRKAVGVAFVVAGSYGLIGVAIAPAHGDAATGLPQPTWVFDEAEGLAIARRDSRPVMIDAYADWCVACRELDRFTYSDATVLTKLERFVSIKLDFTEQDDHTRALQRKYGIVGLPTVIFFDSAGNEIVSKRLLGFEPPDRFADRLHDID